jgi:hypothetical protein
MLPLGPLATAAAAEGAERKEGPESSNLLFVNERGGDGAKKRVKLQMRARWENGEGQRRRATSLHLSI